MVEEVQAQGLVATHQSVDKATDSNDLLAEQTYGYHHDLASNGEVDGYRAWPVCSSFSQGRGRPNGPPPVRDAKDIYGLPGDPRAQQDEAVRGTKMVVRSLDLANLIIRSADAERA